MNIYKKIQNLRNRLIHGLDTNMGSGEDDYVIVSYPKSGNTWVRFLIANYLYPNQEVNFYTIHKLIPELEKLKKRKRKDVHNKIFKSHSFYNRNFKNIIYIVRDGRDVYTSYYHYLKNRLSKELSFKDFLINEKYRQGNWGDHVVSWLDHYSDSQNFLVIRYEDLLSDCGNELNKILKFMNIDEINLQRIKKSVELSSFETMKKIELSQGRPDKNLDKATRFVRNGKTQDWVNLFGEKEKEIFKQREGEILIRLGYEKTLFW